MAEAPSDRDAARPFYRVEQDKHGCGDCGAGATWTVVDPDDDAIDASFSDKGRAEHYADWMNRARDTALREKVEQLAARDATIRAQGEEIARLRARQQAAEAVVDAARRVCGNGVISPTLLPAHEALRLAVAAYDAAPDDTAGRQLVDLLRAHINSKYFDQFDRWRVKDKLGNTVYIHLSYKPTAPEEAHDDLDCALPAPPADRWRHKKRGGTYRIIGEASSQVVGEPIGEGDTVVVYRADSDGSLWIRRKDEFFDGRFECIPAIPAPPACDGGEHE